MTNTVNVLITISVPLADAYNLKTGDDISINSTKHIWPKYVYGVISDIPDLPKES